MGNALGWRHAARFAIDTFDRESILYCVEDDYLHLKESKLVVLDGISKADYISLYDHPDKYNNPNHPYVENGGELSRILLGINCHWKTSNSTTMTFAVKAGTLKEDWPVWEKHTADGFPNDFEAFQQLSSLGNWNNKLFGSNRTLITSIPAFSTHTEKAFLSPLVDWSNV